MDDMKALNLAVEIANAEDVQLPEELSNVFIDAFVDYLKVVQKIVTYVYGDNPTREQAEAAIFMMCMRNEKQLEGKFGRKLP